jgi:hypothetical protein
MAYLKVLLLCALAWALNTVAPVLLHIMGQLSGAEGVIAQTLWCLGLFLGFGWLCSHAAVGTLFTNFTLQLLGQQFVFGTLAGLLVSLLFIGVARPVAVLVSLLMPLTAWVVIWTLTLLPALTPWWARRLNMLE